MIDCKLPEELTSDFLELMPLQREITNVLFAEGKLINYALSIESSRIWAIFNANSENELYETMAKLPLMEFLEPTISQLTFYNTVQKFSPSFSFN